MRPPEAGDQTDNLDTLCNLSFYESYESGMDLGRGRGAGRGRKYLTRDTGACNDIGSIFG